MTKKEKKLLWVFLGILVIGVLARLVPLAFNSYHSGIEDVEHLKEKIHGLNKLQAREQYWRKEFEKNNNQEQQLLTQLFVGQSPDLIAARVQSQLKALARRSGITVDSMSLPDLKQSEDWLLMSQTMSFKAPTENLMELLTMINKSKPALIVTNLQIRIYRKILSCTIKVVGFSRTTTAAGSES